jgi:hypothetical protein
MKDDKQRTGLQNKSLHLYCTNLANALNDAGLDMKKTLKPEIEIPWTCQSVKDHLYKPILKSLTGKDSTIDMDTKDPSIVYEILNRFMGEKHGITVQWPDKESQSYEAMGINKR